MTAEPSHQAAGDLNREAERRDTMTKERFLTVRWNNLLTLALGIPTLVFGAVVLTTPALSDFRGFVGLVLLGAVY